MDIKTVLSKAWHITWKHRMLWVLGVLASCSGSGRGIVSQVSGTLRYWVFPPGFISGFDPGGLPPPEYFDRMVDETGSATVAGAILLGVSASLIGLILGVLGQAALIVAFGRADDGQGELSLSDTFSLGREHFWPLLGIRITVWIGVWVATGVGIALFGIAVLGTGLVRLAPLLIPLAIAADAYIVLSMVAAVEERVGAFEAFGKAWQLTRTRLRPIGVTTLILVLGGWALSVVVLVPLAAVPFPAVIGYVSESRDIALAGFALSNLCLVLGIPLVLLLSGLLTSYVTGVLSLAYRRLKPKPGAAEPIRGGATRAPRTS